MIADRLRVLSLTAQRGGQHVFRGLACLLKLDSCAQRMAVGDLGLAVGVVPIPAITVAYKSKVRLIQNTWESTGQMVRIGMMWS